VRKPAWDSMSLRRAVPVFEIGREYTIRTHKAIYNLARVDQNGGSQIVVRYFNDRNEPVHEGIMLADILSAQGLS
jgi:hypothetical protein